MPRIRRKEFIPGVFYHIFNRGNNKKRIFIEEDDYEFFMKRFIALANIYKIDVKVLVLMRNHFHCLLTPTLYSDIPKFMLRLCTAYAHYYNNKYRKVGHVFQGRYKAKEIITYRGVENVFNYILENPVKEGYCDDYRDYRWLWRPGTPLEWDRPEATP